MNQRRRRPEHTPTSEPKPSEYTRLRGPRRTPWGTLAWSDPAAPPIELFGPPPAAAGEIEVIGEVADGGERRDPEGRRTG